MVLTTAVGLSAILALIVGLLILISPRILNIAVGLYLIIVGILGLIGSL